MTNVMNRQHVRWIGLIILAVVIMLSLFAFVLGRDGALDAINMLTESAANAENSDAEGGAVVQLPGTSRSAISNGPLQVCLANPRYFCDGSGKAIFLTGSHTWDNRQDLGNHIFDYAEYLTLLEQWNHNFVRFWVWEQPKGITTWPDPAEPLATLTPEIFARTGPGNAADGGLKFDVTQYNQAHFDRLRQRIIDAGNRGIYISVMLFDGWSVEQKSGGANPWTYHPFNKDNNINNIDGDANADQSGRETHTLQIAAVVDAQEAYVQKVIDTVIDLDNVLYEISNESHVGSRDWQYHMIYFIKNYEATKPKQHPVGMTVPWPEGDNDDLFDSPADWISPNDYFDPPPSDGSKVIVVDTDHMWGIGGDRQWVWESFTRGHSVIYMDPWNGQFIPVSAEPEVRINMGYSLSYADRMNLVAMTPRGDLCSTDYCLANPSASSAEYLVYQPHDSGFSVDLSGTSGQLLVEWLNPETGEIFDTGSVPGGGNRNFTAPFSGDSVLYLYHEPLATPTLSIEKSGPIVAREDTPIAYLLSVENNGRTEATNLVITDRLPDGATYMSGGKLNGNIVTWNVSKLPANGLTAVSFTVKASDTIVNSEYGVTADGGYEATGSKIVTTLITSHFIHLPMVITMTGGSLMFETD